MRTSQLPRVFLTGLACLSLFAGDSVAGTAASAPVGCMSYTLTSGAKTALGVPLLELPTLSAIASSVTTNTINVSGVTWAGNQFASSAPYFVAIRTGPQAGRTLLVLSNTANTLTVDVEDTPLNTAGFAVTGGSDGFDLFQGDTLGSLFGTAADASGFLASGLKAGTSTSNADSIQLFSGGVTVTYYFSTTVGTWVLSGGGSTNRNGLILYPDDGMLLQRRGPNGSLTFLGRVPVTRQLTKLPGGTTTWMSSRFPVDTTLGTLNFGAPGTWISGSSSSVADNVGVWTGSKWDIYYKNTSNVWIKSNGGSTNQGGLIIRKGTSIRIVKRGTATGSTSFLGQNVPYSP